MNTKPNYLNAVNVVLLALFLPKFDLLDTYILRSNLSKIVCQRYLGH